MQDPYSLRCQPQVMGACLDQMRYAAGVFEREAAAVTDNPLVFGDEILSGGNFHAEPVALAADALALAIAEIGALSERRVALLIDPPLSGLPPFLVEHGGVNSGFMVAQVTAAALASENKSLAHPASVDSLPTSANQEDHVSMATFAARRLSDMAANSAGIVAIELLAAAQGIDFRRPRKTSRELGEAHAWCDRRSRSTDHDRYRPRHHRGVVAGRGGRVPQLRARAPRPRADGAVRSAPAARRSSYRCRSPARMSHGLFGVRMTEDAVAAGYRLAPERLYDFLDQLGASVLVATHSRYVVDLNRPPDNANLYPGQDTTPLVPLDTFHRQPLYRPGQEPDTAEIAERVQTYWKPYHSQLSGELESLKRQHGYALLWDAHSIFSEVPRFFSASSPRSTPAPRTVARAAATGEGPMQARRATTRCSTAVSAVATSRALTATRQWEPTRCSSSCRRRPARTNSIPLNSGRLAVRLCPQLRALVEEFCRPRHGRRTG